MSTNYPTAIDALTRPTAGDPLSSSNGRSQTQMLDDVMDAAEAIEAKVGVNGSAVTTTLDYKVAANTTALAAKADTSALTAYLPKLAAGASVEDVGAIESRAEVATVTGTKTADTSVYNVFRYTMSASTTFTFSNPAPANNNTTFMLILSGAFTPTLPASVKWGDGTAATYTTPSIYTFTTVDAGTTWYASQVGKAFA